MRNDHETLEELTARVSGILYPDAIDVALDGNIAVLQGTVASLAKKNEVAMAAAYVPGIEGIDNRLTVHAPEYIL